MGPPMRLVFIHAAGSSGDEWVQQRLAFANRYEVRTPDLPGHGSNRDAPRSSIEDMAAWIAAELGELSDDVLIGHSMGASVAMTTAADRAPRGLVLVGATRRPRVPNGFVERVSRDATVAVERLATAGFARGTASRLVERASGYLARTDTTVLARDFAASSRYDATPFLGRIRAPTLIISGAEDRLTTVAEADEVARAIAGARLVAIEGAGHMVMLERPREFNDALATFVESLR